MRTIEARPFHLAQGDKIHKGAQRPSDKGGELVEGHALDAAKEAIIGNGQRMIFEGAEFGGRNLQRFTPRRHAGSDKHGLRNPAMVSQRAFKGNIAPGKQSLRHREGMHRSASMRLGKRINPALQANE